MELFCLFDEAFETSKTAIGILRRMAALRPEGELL